MIYTPFSAVCANGHFALCFFRYEMVSNGQEAAAGTAPVTTSTSNDETHQRLQSHILNLNAIELTDTGNFSCFDHASNSTNVTYEVQAIIPPKIDGHSPAVVQRNITQTVTFFCLFKVHPAAYFDHLISWKVEETEHSEDADFSDYKRLVQTVKNNTKVTRIDEQLVNVTLELENINKKHNGTYICSVEKSAHIDVGVEYESFTTTLLVMDRPQLLIDFTKAVGADKIYMNWTINDGNDPVKLYILSFLKQGAKSRQYYFEVLKGSNTSHVFTKFEKASLYDLNLCAKNNWGESCHTVQVRTLDKDPVFVPKVEAKGNTHSTITIGWAPPPQDLLDFIQYYKVKAYLAADNSSVIEESHHPQNSRNLPYMFDNLKVATEYSFQVKACSELTQECGNWSEVVNGVTMDGLSSAPLNLKVKCEHLKINGRNKVEVEFLPPTTPNGVLISYQIVLSGMSTYRSDKKIRNETWGPKTKTSGPTERRVVFEPVPPNTNYTITVAGVTRSRRPGDTAEIRCTMPPTTPDYSGRLNWGKVKEQASDNWVFKLFLPRASERNGPICCYRIYMVRLADQSNGWLPPPDELDVLTFGEVHAANNTKGGAYIAEILTADDFHSEVLLGDGKQMEASGAGKGEDKPERSNCKSCWQNLQRKIPRKVEPTEPANEEAELPEELPTTVVPPQVRRRR